MFTTTLLLFNAAFRMMMGPSAVVKKPPKKPKNKNKIGLPVVELLFYNNYGGYRVHV